MLKVIVRNVTMPAAPILSNLTTNDNGKSTTRGCSDCRFEC